MLWPKTNVRMAVLWLKTMSEWFASAIISEWPCFGLKPCQNGQALDQNTPATPQENDSDLLTSCLPFRQSTRQQHGTAVMTRSQLLAHCQHKMVCQTQNMVCFKHCGMASLSWQGDRNTAAAPQGQNSLMPEWITVWDVLSFQTVKQSNVYMQFIRNLLWRSPQRPPLPRVSWAEWLGTEVRWAKRSPTSHRPPNAWSLTSMTRRTRRRWTRTLAPWLEQNWWTWPPTTGQTTPEPLGWSRWGWTPAVAGARWGTPTERAERHCCGWQAVTWWCARWPPSRGRTGSWWGRAPLWRRRPRRWEGGRRKTSRWPGQRPPWCRASSAAECRTKAASGQLIPSRGWSLRTLSGRRRTRPRRRKPCGVWGGWSAGLERSGSAGLPPWPSAAAVVGGSLPRPRSFASWRLRREHQTILFIIFTFMYHHIGRHFKVQQASCVKILIHHSACFSVCFLLLLSTCVYVCVCMYGWVHVYAGGLGGGGRGESFGSDLG